ncbi:hypothetical protein PENARI_c015G09970 [Penicillium arizonense]|uniref:Hydrophobin n=1 Tax=Penicillium arizonense TaxID=1835702 RepID=A0A1F5LD80_PENAI|nr:hypothetical protein PENARI_c015G09970 [Penicillium arizonense]OGE51006.1 hypothetical protein PENARI_c015G09970 [Penicillium arizonense]
MHLITMFLALAPVLAVPFNAGGNGGSNGGPVCNAGLLYTQAQCCKTGVLNLADLDCKSSPRSYNGLDDFKAGCASDGRAAKCCSIPVAGLGLVCNDVA